MLYYFTTFFTLLQINAVYINENIHNIKAKRKDKCTERQIYKHNKKIKMHPRVVLHVNFPKVRVRKRIEDKIFKTYQQIK